ncbi:MAG: hypothetical protein CK424_06370 [Legionella sp.]|nr:MAG: hypothetical protein CK424_06370 [Legionella sp.]
MLMRLVAIDRKYNSAFTACLLEMLLPLGQKSESEFNQIFQRLFRRAPDPQLYADLKKPIIPQYDTFIRLSYAFVTLVEQIRAQTADYLRDNPSVFNEYDMTEVERDLFINTLRTNTSIDSLRYDHIELAILSKVLGVEIRVYRDHLNTESFSQYHPEKNNADVLNLIIKYGQYSCLFEDTLVKKLDLKPKHYIFSHHFGLYPAKTADDLVHMQTIKDLCNTYLTQTKDPRKIKILKELHYANNINNVAYWLHRRPYDLANTHITAAQILRENELSSSAFALRVILVFLTFPISIPVLSFLSWIQRGKFNFIQSKGSIFVDDIDAICQRHISEYISKQSRECLPSSNKRNINENETTPLLNSSQGSSFMMTHFKPKPQDVSPYTLNHYINNNGQRVEAYENLNHTLGIGLAGLLGDYEEITLQRNTGTPVITSYKIEPSTNGALVIHVRYKFRWTEEASRCLSLNFVKGFESDSSDVSERTPINLPVPAVSVLQQYVSYGLSVFEPSFDQLIVEGSKHDEIHKQERILQRAYAKAKNDGQKTIALETLINVQGLYYKYVERGFILSHYKDTGFENILPQVTKKIQNLKEQLPTNHQNLSPTAKQFKGMLESIHMLIHSGQIGEAWAQFKEQPEPSPLIKLVYPRLFAWYYELRAVFEISRHRKYGNEKYRETSFLSEPQSIENLLFTLNLAYESLEKIDPMQARALHQTLMVPIQEIIALGTEAASRTPLDVRRRIRESEVAADMLIWGTGVDGTYRVEDEDALSGERTSQLSIGVLS